jgi:hypothetical protein
MLLTMKAPANRDRGERTVRCNEAQASILRKVGWTDVETQHATHYVEQGSSPPDIDIEPNLVTDPDEVRPQTETPYLHPIKPKHERQGTSYDPDATGHELIGRDAKPKRKYHRRTVNVEPDGKVNYSIKPPKRRYRRRDMQAED